MLKNVVPATVDGATVPLFRYYTYVNGVLTPLTTLPLNAADAARTVQVVVSFGASPLQNPTARLPGQRDAHRHRAAAVRPGERDRDLHERAMHMTGGDIARTTIRDEGGFTMAVVMIVGFVTAMIVGVSLTAANGDLNLTRNDLDQKQAFEAAQAGIADYQYHLNSDTNFWTNCATVPTPTAVNLQGSTTRRLAVPGSTGSTYAIELLRASTSPGSANCSTADPAGTMLEGAASVAPGTFRIRSTGYAGDSKQSIVATWKRRSFLDYIYFTQLETSDPVTYGDPATVAGAYTQCTKKIGPIWSQGRYGAPIPNSGGDYCVVIQFAPQDDVLGPFHTNDAIVTCQNPTFGRTAADRIEISTPVSVNGGAATPYLNSLPNPPGLSSSCNDASPDFVGTLVTPAPDLEPPPTNQKLASIAASAYQFSGETSIELTASNIRVTPQGATSATTLAYPANGVIYVSNSSSGACSSAYSPFTARTRARPPMTAAATSTSRAPTTPRN